MLTSSGSAGNYTLTATVTGFGRGAPTGNVSFNDTTSTTSLGIAALSASTLASSFTAQQSYAIGAQPQGVAMGDFNGDGILDIAAVNEGSGTASILLGNGDGTFQAQTTYNATDVNGDQPQYIAAGDFNGDGKLDLAFGTLVLLGNGDGTFTPGAGNGYNFGGPLVVGDFNGDGILDVAVAGAVFLGKGDGTFPTRVVPLDVAAGIEQIFSMVEGDFNADGKLDLAITCLDYNGNYWLVSVLGNGDGTFQPVVQSALTTVTYLAAGDVNGDGKPDLILSNSTQIGAMLGNGDGTFQTATAYPAGGSGPVAVADFNGDGKQDVLTVYSGNAALLLGNGDGTFQAAVSFPSGSSPSAVAVADLNGDGRLDVVDTNSSSNGTVGVLLGVATETASLTGVAIPGSGAQSVDAIYAGDTSFGTSTSSTVSLAGSQASTALILSASSTNVAQGSPVTLTATLSPASNGSATTDGETIIFLNGTSTLGTGTLSGGVATYTTSTLPTGSNSITALYAGNAYFTLSQSPAVLVNVGTPPPTGPTTTLSVSPSSGGYGTHLYDDRIVFGDGGHTRHQRHGHLLRPVQRRRERSGHCGKRCRRLMA